MRISPRFSSIHENLQGILLNLPAFDAMRALETRCRGEAEPMMDASAGAPLLRSQIRFEQVSFAYRGADHAQIFNASFDIPVNRITALIGPSGAGKSTLADLALGLIEPSTGRILIDDVVLDGGNQRAWRDHIAYVPQDVFLLHDTISGNLLIANPHASEADIWLALKQANAEGFVRKLPDRLDTVLGERGVRLSGGERQRIALARALLRRPRLLILDEGTSALDWESQAMIARSIESLRGQMTILTIAHRPSMIAFADHVIAINGGRIVERGSYSDLIRRSDSHLSHLVAGEAAADRRVS
jgi:ATP-binding cassette subfamily C protein